MRILLVQHNIDLSELWARFLQRQGVDVVQAATQLAAINKLRFEDFDALVLDLVLPDGGAIAISDYATYRCPDVPIIAVTSTSFFSDGSIFDLIPNARSLMRTPLRPDDLAAVLEHYVPRKPAALGKPEVA
ncbi:hypothetical protein A9Q96_14760 [Rhodobacterales bacterium 52_120_T64]|nr:hypothetical protein A9Q96_14760 [Rhodobacterales bacterium 52_120_T64]